jgi:5-methylcytosine-specific restriction protein B
MDKIAGKGASMAYDFLQKARADETEFEEKKKIAAVLTLFFTELKKVGAEFGYRTASEIFQYAGKVKLLETNTAEDSDQWSVKMIIDTAIVQKLLPKLHGSRRKLEPVLKKLMELCMNDTKKLEDLLKKDPESDYNKNTDIQYPISFEKLQRMYNRLIQDGFTSFAEA